MGSDPVKCLLLGDNKFRNRGFLLLEGTFWGQKVPSKSWRGMWGQGSSVIEGLNMTALPSQGQDQTKGTKR